MKKPLAKTQAVFYHIGTFSKFFYMIKKPYLIAMSDRVRYNGFGL